MKPCHALCKPPLFNAFRSSPLVGSHKPKQSSWRRARNRPRRACCALAQSCSEDISVDIVVVGGGLLNPGRRKKNVSQRWVCTGIIGLCIANELLACQLSVALVERDVPCSGATGAGMSQHFSTELSLLLEHILLSSLSCDTEATQSHWHT